MTAIVHAQRSTHEPRAQRYRAAEQRLWARFGLAPTERFIDSGQDGGGLRVLELGAGNPVLFIPGTGGTGPYWAPLVRELASRHQCILLDRPGWGLSTPVDYRNQSIADIAVTTQNRVLDALGIGQADVVGASIGGLWAVRLAQGAADRVRSIAIIGGGPMIDLPVPRFIRMLASPIGALIVRFSSSPRMLHSQLEALGHGPSLAAGRMDEFVAWRMAFGRETDSMRNERAMVQATLGPDGWRPGFIPTENELSSIQHPTRFVFGSADPTGTIDTWRTFAERLPQGELKVVDGAGHMPWWDEPATVGRLVGEFLARG
jgi:pimeloyl-ACP methyl ester carboxylesterase